MKHSLLLNIFLINIIKTELLHLYMNHRYMYAHKVNNYCLCSEAIHFHWSKIHFQSYTVPYWPPPSHTVWTPSAWRSSCELAPCLFFPFLVSADNCSASGNQKGKNKFISTRKTYSKYEGILHECDFVYLNGLFLFCCHFMFMLGCQVVHFSRPFCLQMVKFYGLAAQCLFKCEGKKEILNNP